jgi:hypothetical protein
MTAGSAGAIKQARNSEKKGKGKQKAMEAGDIDKVQKKRTQKLKRKVLEANDVDKAGPERKRPRKNQSGEFHMLPQDLASSHPFTLL